MGAFERRIDAELQHLHQRNQVAGIRRAEWIGEQRWEIIVQAELERIRRGGLYRIRWIGCIAMLCRQQFPCSIHL